MIVDINYRSGSRFNTLSLTAEQAANSTKGTEMKKYYLHDCCKIKHVSCDNAFNCKNFDHIQLNEMDEVIEYTDDELKLVDQIKELELELKDTKKELGTEKNKNYGLNTNIENANLENLSVKDYILKTQQKLIDRLEDERQDKFFKEYVSFDRNGNPHNSTAE